MIFGPRCSAKALSALTFLAATLFCAGSKIQIVVAQESKLPAAKLSQIEAITSKFLADTHTPGVSVGIVEDGDYEWAGGFGFADLENGVPASPTTLYRLGSISKSITAVGAMQLVERGTLDLDAPVQKYCPAFPEKQKPITTREVMGHLAGIRHYKETADDQEIGNTKHFDDPIQAGLDFFKNDPLVDDPGKHFHYSTQGYTLVGCVMQGASGEKYVDYMRQNVFARAGMTDTQADNRFAIIAHRTRFYDKTKSGTVENADFLDSSYKVPGGGWLSDADDMARFIAAILNDKLIQRSTRDLMWTPLKPSDGSKDSYGLGWGVGDQSGTMLVGHTGGQQGTSTAFVIAPAQKAGVVVLANMEEVDANKLAHQILQVLLGGEEREKKK